MQLFLHSCSDLLSYKGIPNSLLWVVVIIAIYTYIASKTTTGRYFYAVGGNEKATKLSGIDTNKVYFLAYLNMGLLAAIAGMVTMARLNSSTHRQVQTSRWMRSVHVSSVVLLLMVVPVQFRCYHWCPPYGCSEPWYEYHGY